MRVVQMEDLGQKRKKHTKGIYKTFSNNNEKGVYDTFSKKSYFYIF